MTDMQPLLALLAQTERERDDALSAHTRSMATHQGAAAQAEQLLTYRREYEQRWGEQFKQLGRIEVVNCYHGFTERLTQAVTQQQRVMAQTAQQVERARLVLVEHEMRVASVRKLIERRRQEMRAGANRREQKATDEAASRSSWNRQGGVGLAPGRLV